MRYIGFVVPCSLVNMYGANTVGTGSMGPRFL